MEESIRFAKKYVEDLLSFFGLNIDVYATSSDGEVIEVNIPSTHLNGFLIGQHGENMRALQFLVSNALRNAEFELSRVNVDVADYKHQRAERLTKQAEEWMRTVRETSNAMDLRPMNAADRRIVHQLAADMGVTSESVGEGVERHIVLKPTTETTTE